MKPGYILLLIIATFGGCKKDLTPADVFSNNYFTTFRFQSVNNPKLTVDVVAEVDDTTVTCSLPIGISPDSLIASFKTNDGVDAVTANTAQQVSGSTVNNFTNPVTYILRGRDNSIRRYQVSVKPFSGLPIIYLTTEGGAAITSKEDYVNGRITINSNFSKFSGFDNTMQIKVRGNYTSTLPKKPYKVKLTSKASLLGMPADKEWALLANYDDKSLMRNYIAFKLSEIFGLPFTPRSTFADVFLNGVYQGNYQLCETVKIATNRVNIKSMDETDISGEKLTGGYLFEVDSRLDGTDTFVTNKNIGFVIHDPEYGQAAQINYLKNYVQQLEDAIYSPNFADNLTGYRKYLNAPTAIEWFWVNEISRNLDAYMNSSVYMYKDRDSTVHVGPAWDFDLGFGNYRMGDKVSYPEGWYIRDAPWFSRLFHDPAFTQQAVTKWYSVRTRLDSLYDFIDATALNLKYSRAKDGEVWNNQQMYVYPNNGIAGSYEGEVNYMKNWLSARMKWIDANLQTLQN